MTTTHELDLDTEAAENHTRKRPADRPIVVQFQGAPPSSSSSGPRASRPDKWVNLAEDGEYAEHQIRIRLRVPDSIMNLTVMGDVRAYHDGLRQIVLEHNGWLDPEKDEPVVLPPTDQLCKHDKWLDDELARELISFADAMTRAAAQPDVLVRRNAIDAAESAHLTKEQQLRAAAVKKKGKREDPLCCFWDSLDSAELQLVNQAIRLNRRERVNFLLGTKND